MKVMIIKAIQKDAKELLAIQKRAFKPLYAIYHDEKSPYLHTLDMMKERISRSYADYYKIMADDKLAGSVCIYKKSEVYYWVAIIYIAPEFQNNKIAQTALKQVEAKYPKAKKWGLDFPVDRIANKKCYEALGYLDTGKREIVNDKLTLALYEKTV